MVSVSIHAHPGDLSLSLCRKPRLPALSARATIRFSRKTDP
jgi:hypothetical protein